MNFDSIYNIAKKSRIKECEKILMRYFKTRFDLKESISKLTFNDIEKNVIKTFSPKLFGLSRTEQNALRSFLKKVSYADANLTPEELTAITSLKEGNYYKTNNGKLYLTDSAISALHKVISLLNKKKLDLTENENKAILKCNTLYDLQIAISKLDNVNLADLNQDEKKALLSAISKPKKFNLAIAFNEKEILENIHYKIYMSLYIADLDFTPESLLHDLFWTGNIDFNVKTFIEHILDINYYQENKRSKYK